VAAEAIRWLGTAYLLWLAWSLMRASESKSLSSGPFTLPLSFSQAAVFQYLNPKAWMLSAATAGAFMAGDEPLTRGALAAAIFAVTAFASLLVWAALGAALRAWLAHGARLRVFNIVMGASLALTALWMVLR
jgi:threonine/homoserine/homoserine lactone efflux protein